MDKPSIGELWETSKPRLLPSSNLSIEQFWEAAGESYGSRATYTGPERLSAVTQAGLALRPSEIF